MDVSGPGTWSATLRSAVVVGACAGVLACAPSWASAGGAGDRSQADPGMEPASRTVVARIVMEQGSTLPARCFDGFRARSDRRFVVIQTAGGPCNGVYADGWSLYRRAGGSWTGPLVSGFPGVPSGECGTVSPRIPADVLRDLRADRFCTR